MAGPLSGIGSGQTQVPLSNSFQPGQNNASQVRPERQQREQETNTVQAPRTPVSSTQNSDTDNQRAARPASYQAEGNGELASSGDRGSVIDITV